MKKVLSVLMVVAAMMFATNANAQIKFGLPCRNVRLGLMTLSA